jgi:hypothetical protein
VCWIYLQIKVRRLDCLLLVIRQLALTMGEAIGDLEFHVMPSAISASAQSSQQSAILSPKKMFTIVAKNVDRKRQAARAF